VTAAAVEGMKSGSVIVDLAGETGGNCELTEPGRTVVKHGVTIESGTNWGRSRGQCLPISSVGEAGIPAVKVRSQFVVEDAGADL